MIAVLSIPLQLSQIAEYTKGLKTADGVVKRVVTDSREAMPGDLFIALPGKNTNGENYIREAENKGAYTICKRSKCGITVKDGFNVLPDLAKAYKKLLPRLRKTVGITGSVGKTTTKEFLKTILSKEFRTHANEGNFNNLIGMPLTVLSAPICTEVLVLEMGMNAPGEIERLSLSATPDIAVITRIGNAHIGNLGSRKAIAEAKLEIRRGLKGPLAVPYSEPLLIGDVSFSAENENADVFVNRNGHSVYCKIIGQDAFTADFFVNGKHNLECLGAAICAANLCGSSKDAIKTGISSISAVNQRQDIIKHNNLTFITDYYNASPESVEAGLRMMAEETGYSAKSLLLGDMLELGSFSRHFHREVGKLARKVGLRHLFLFGKEARIAGEAAIESGFPKENVFLNADTERPDLTAESILSVCRENELIFCKGSRGIKLERIMEYILRQ